MRKTGRFGRRALSNIVVVCVGVLFYLLLSNFGLVWETLGFVFSICAPFVAGLVLAYLLNMPMQFLERNVFKNAKRRRGLSIFATYVLALALVCLLVLLVLPQLWDSISRLVISLPSYLANLNEFLQATATRFELQPETVQSFLLNYNDLLRQITQYVRNSLPNLLDYTMQFGSGVVSALTALIASIYMLAGKDKLLRQARRVLYALLPTPKASGLLQVATRANKIFSGFIGGQLFNSAIIGGICFVFMGLMNFLSAVLGLASLAMPFSLLISVVIGITNVIPFFGPFIGTIPSALILFMVNPWSSLWFSLFILVLQQFDGNVLSPKILGDSTGLPALWVLVSIIVGQQLFGFAGMLLGVPTVAVLYTLTSDFIKRRLKQKNLPAFEDSLNDGETPTLPTAPVLPVKEEPNAQK